MAAAFATALTPCRRAARPAAPNPHNPVEVAACSWDPESRLAESERRLDVVPDLLSTVHYVARHPEEERTHGALNSGRGRPARVGGPTLQRMPGRRGGGVSDRG
jgi:hypothetical protein